jgi:LmbE family N-acetylglucosaminyl deacetylase
MTQEQDGPLRILVVVAHPHDFTHCSGTCGIHAANGDAVTLVTVTDGSLTHNEKLHDELMKPEVERDPAVINQSPQDYAAIKAAEIRQICGLFGVEDVRILTWPQPFRLEQVPKAVDALQEIILEVRPHVLITQRPYYSGRQGLASMARDDHNETAIAVLEAKGLASIPNSATKVRPHSIAATYYMGVYFMPDEIDFYVDISAWYDQRVQAEMLFKSQSQTEAFARKRVEIGAGTMGWSAHTAYAEGFVRAEPEVLPSIIVPHTALARAAGLREDQLKRVAGEL